MNQDIEILRILAKYDKEIEKLYNKLLYQLSKVSLNITKIREGAFFSFDDYPEIKEKVNGVLNSYSKEQQDIILSGINTAMIKSFKANEAKFGEFSRYTNQAIIEMRNTAKNAFIESRMKPEQGLSLSQKVWNYTQQGKAEFEAGMSEILEEGLLSGTSAEELGRKLRSKLKHPDMVYKRYHLKKMTAKGKKDVVEWRRKVVDSEGKVHYVKEDLEKVGRGVYRSSRKNALRLTATEINMAYRYADYVRWNSEPFVVGFRIQLSENHTLNGKPFYDMCDDLVGVYPKTFKWAGWHPRCYSDDSEVLTNQGWKLFKDVQQSDLILSLNPDTKNVEWVTIRQRMNWHHKGDMIHYSNRSLDCLVTPEHEMVYLAKSTGKISRKDASEFKMSNGAFYRSCEYDANDRPAITIGNTSISFDSFCEFMGYWLSDGSTIRTVQIVIAQQDGDPNKQNIVECIEKMGFRVHTNNAKVEFYSKDLCQYLKQFGKCNTKFIPQVIKSASRRQIQIFLDAFISCDGYVKKPRPFVGSHGNVCVSKNPERIYFTTSKQLEADLGELILKIGKRPSFGINNKAGKVCHFKNGDYKTNYDCYSITECQATTATVFDKSVEEYDGMVYDLELSKNHIMYIRRNGKCFWGSNCRCIATSILVSKEEMEKISELPDDEYRNYRSPNLVKKMPKAYDEYVKKEKDRILASMDRGTSPYWVRDNYKQGDIRKKFVWERVGKTKFKTQAQKDAIQKAWDERRRKNAILAAAEKRHAKRDAVAIQEAWDLRKEKYSKLIKTAKNVSVAAHGNSWVDSTNLNWLINKKKYHLLEAEYRKVAKELSLANKRKKQLSTLIPDVESWAGQFSYDELKAVFDSVEKKMTQWSSLTLEQQQKKLTFEIVDYLGGNMGGVQQKYSTWKVSQAAYSNKLQKVNLEIYKDSIKKDVADFITWTTNHPKATGVYKKVMDLVDMVSDDSIEIAVIKQKFGDIKSHIKQLEKEAAQRAAKKAPSIATEKTSFDSDAYSKERKDAAMWAKDGMEADNQLRSKCGEVWRSATDAEKEAIFGYTYEYNNVNEPLRGLTYYGSAEKTARGLSRIPNIESIINKSTYDFDMWVQRGDDLIALKKFGLENWNNASDSEIMALVGKEGIEGAFWSAGVAKGKGLSGQVTFNIYMPKGTKAMYCEPFSAYGNGAMSVNWDGFSTQTSISREAEILIQRGTKFRVTKVEKGRNRNWFVDVEVIEQSPVEFPYKGGYPFL